MSSTTLGLIGLGAMGRPIAANLVRAGHRVLGHDLSAERLSAAAAEGVELAASAEALVDAAEVVLTSLPSSDAFVRCVEDLLLPRIRADQLVVDLGTVTPPETRRLAAAFRAKGADLVDAPLSGGPRGAERGDLHVFVGGENEPVRRAWPLLEVIGGRITHCGPPGAGQVVKGVNQLAMGLGAAAYVEAVAFGVLGGVDPAVVARAIGGEGDFRGPLGRIAERIARGEGEGIGVKFRELPYFLREAAEAGFELPLTETLHRFCEPGERVVVDDNRPAPSFLHELLRQRG